MVHHTVKLTFHCIRMKILCSLNTNDIKRKCMNINVMYRCKMFHASLFLLPSFSVIEMLTSPSGFRSISWSKVFQITRFWVVWSCLSVHSKSFRLHVSAVYDHVFPYRVRIWEQRYCLYQYQSSLE